MNHGETTEHIEINKYSNTTQVLHIKQTGKGNLSNIDCCTSYVSEMQNYIPDDLCACVCDTIWSCDNIITELRGPSLGFSLFELCG